MKTLLALPVLLFLAIIPSCAQQDSTFTDADTTVETEGDGNISQEESNEATMIRIPPDSLKLNQRSFSEDQVQRLQSDPDLDYEQPPTVAESLWDRFWAWVRYLMGKLFTGAVTTDWGRLIVYAIAMALLVAVVMLMLKVNAFKILYSGRGAAQPYQVLDENIHEMDFDKLIQEATDRQDYRRGIRLLFLYALKLLSDRQLIHWESGKTNHEYVGELSNGALRNGLNELSFYFDYAWYGNFAINSDTFGKAQNTFVDWKSRLG